MSGDALPSALAEPAGRRYFIRMLATILLAAAVVQAPPAKTKSTLFSPTPPPAAPPVEEEFEDNRRGWLEGANADYEAKVEHGHYTVSKKVAGGTLYTWIGIAIDPSRPFTLATHFKVESGGEDGGVGVVWSLLDRRTFNGVYVTRRGLTTWGHNVDGAWQADTAWNNRLAYFRFYRSCNTGPEGTFDVAIEPYQQTGKLGLKVNGCLLAILPNRYKGPNFGFVINGTARIKIESFAVRQE